MAFNACFWSTEIILLINSNLQYIQDFNILSMYSLANEPGTLKFGAFQPRGEEKSNQIFALEQYVLQFGFVYLHPIDNN